MLLTPTLRKSSRRTLRQLNTTTQRTNFFLFSTGTQTPPVQQTMTLQRLLPQIDPVARPLTMPTCSLSTEIEHQIWKRLFQVVSEQNSIDEMRRGRMTFQMSSQITDCIRRFFCCLRHLRFDVMGALWAVVSCLVWPQLTAECPLCFLLPRGVKRCPASPCHAQSNRSTVVIRKAPHTVLMTWCGGAPRKTHTQQHKHHDSGKAALPDYILFARPLTMPT